jgi:HSP20 family protein
MKEDAMAIVRWDPLREVAQLQDRLNRVVSESYRRSGADEGFMSTGEWVPPVDIYADGDHEPDGAAPIA